MKNLAERIKSNRKEKGWSQTALAEQLNTSQDTVSLWERGISYPDLETLIKLCELFDCSADYLLGRTEY